VAGWVHRRRRLAAVGFLILRDRSGLAQIVVKAPEVRAQLDELGEETVVQVTGTVAANPQAPGGAEIIDPVTGEVLPDGEKGELVFTSLTKQAMPVIRYRTRDLTRLLPGTARTMRRMEKVTGRTDDMIILRGVNLFPTQIEELLLKVPALSPHFQCVLSRSGTLDEMTVRVERRQDVSQDDGGRAGHDLEQLVKATIGVSVAVDVVSPNGIERSVGKMRRILDERPVR